MEPLERAVFLFYIIWILKYLVYLCFTGQPCRKMVIKGITNYFYNFLNFKKYG